MSERYWITGVQLGILIASPEHKGRQKIADGIIEEQFIGHADSPQSDTTSTANSGEDTRVHHAEIKKEIDKDFAKSKDGVAK